MESKIKTNGFTYLVVFFIVTIIAINLVASTHTYDPAWVAMFSFLFIGIPFIIGGSIVMVILLKKKVKFRTQIISAVIIVILIVLAFLPLVHNNGLPGDEWEYNQELSEFYKSSLGGNSGKYGQYRVYLGKTTVQGRDARVYEYIAGWDEWKQIKTGIEKDNKLFIDNVRVYPTWFVGRSNQSESVFGLGRVYIYELPNMDESFKLYLKNESGNVLYNLSEYGLNVGDLIVVYGEIKSDSGDDLYIVIDNAEKAETL